VGAAVGRGQPGLALGANMLVLTCRARTAGAPTALLSCRSASWEAQSSTPSSSRARPAASSCRWAGAD
jgi:hypothetical protein